MSLSNSKASSKLGRKGDPRMHRAVSARLSSPDISLFEALRIGGFDYPTNDDASVMDSEKVTLGQRKNQLSRRLRLARKQSKDGHHDVDGSPELTSVNVSNNGSSQRGSNASASSLSMEAQKELSKLMQHSRSSKINASNNLGARALQMKNQYPPSLGFDEDDPDPEASVDVPEEQQPKRQRVAKFHPDYAPLFVPPAASVRNSFTNPNLAPKTAESQSSFQNQQNAANFVGASNVGNMPSMNMGASASALGAATASFPHTSLFTQQMNNVFTAQQTQQPRASAVAISSLTSSAQAVGMTLEQLAMSLSSNTTSLAKVLTESNGGGVLTKQQGMALHLYENDSKSLYSKSMLLAGIDPRLCQQNSPTYLQFALKAWQAEGKRLHDLMENTRGVGDPPLHFTNEKISENSHLHESSPGAHTTCGSHSHNHGDSKDKDGKLDPSCKGRHVHRLDGQCGHKAIIHQPKNGSAHIDFVIGNKVECYNGIEPLGKKFGSAWPSKYKCSDYEENCSNKCVKNNLRMNDTMNQTEAVNAEPKIINLKDINLQDPEWNYDVNGSIDGGVMGLFKLGEQSDDAMSNI